MHVLNWTTEKPQKEGTYWLSMPPDAPQGAKPRCRKVYVCQSVRCMVTLDFEGPDAYDPVLVVGLNDQAAHWPDSADETIDVHDKRFDGAKWAKPEEPADPFSDQEVKSHA